MPGKCCLQNKISKKLVNYLIVVTFEFNVCIIDVGKFHAKKYAQQDKMTQRKLFNYRNFVGSGQA